MHLKISSGKWRPFCLDLNVWKAYSNGTIWSSHTHGITPDVKLYTGLRTLQNTIYCLWPLDMYALYHKCLLNSMLSDNIELQYIP